MDDDDAIRDRRKAMVRALRETFGDRAADVARIQMELAQNDVASAWQAILAALGA